MFALEEMIREMPETSIQPLITQISTLTESSNTNDFVRVAGFRTLLSISENSNMHDDLIQLLETVTEVEEDTQIKNIFQTLLSGQE